MKTKKQFKVRKGYIRLLILFLLVPGIVNSFSQGQISPGIEKPDNNTLSPYFYVRSDDPESDRLPLKKTDAKINVVGVIADIIITQVYENAGENTLEAIYVFPASTRAAVYAMKMEIGEREIIAVIQEKEIARRNYEQAKANGQTASLLEQERPNVFTMNVANILPGDIIKVELKYSELLIPDAGIYEFVFPTVVGPRYNSGGENHISEDWIANPYLQEGQVSNYSFDINLNISTGLPLQSLFCPSHEVDIFYKGKNKAAVALKNPDIFQGNKDFIIEYRLAGFQIESGLLLYEGDEENFFLAMIQPPKQVTPDIIPPREYIFIVDVSGSMYGFPLDVSKKLMRNLIGNLKRGDLFNVLLFAGGSNLFSNESVIASPENINKAITFIDNKSGGGGTELLPALKRAMSLPEAEGFSRSFIIATDGYVSVERKTFEFINDNLGKANFFTFGIGSSVNRYLIEGMAHVGRGEAFVVTNQKEAKPIASKFLNYISKPVLTGIQVSFRNFNAYDVEPMSIPDVLAERPVILFGKWTGDPEGTIELTGYTGKGKYSKTLDIKRSEPASSNSAIKYLWAREKIRLLDDFIQVTYSDNELESEVTKLGLKYNLLTRFTSFIALDSEIRNQSGNITTVKQPLTLPHGVSNYAVGGVAPMAVKRYSMTYTQQKSNRSKLTGFAEEEYVTAVDETREPEIFFITEDMPEFQGGMEALKSFLEKNLKFPESLRKKGITGFVYVSFIIDKDGSVKDIKVIRGIHPDADKEAVRLIELTDKKWKPGKQKGEKVAVQMMVPIKFSDK